MAFGQYCGQDHSDYGGEGQAGDGYGGGYGDAVASDAQDDDDGGDHQVPAVSEVQPVVDQNPDADGGDHSV